MFLLTTAKFCKNNDSVLQNSLNGVAVWSIMPKIDGRGKAQSTKKVSYELSCSPVEPFNSIISHLKHEHAPNPMLPCPSKKTLKHTIGAFSCEVCLSVFKEFNASFSKLGHEQC